MNTEQIGFRIDPDLKNQLQALADAESRSLSQYILLQLKRAIGTPKRKAK